MKKINFKNKPDTTTPINSTNLNQLQDNIEETLIAIGTETPSNDEKLWVKKSANIFKITKNITNITGSYHGIVYGSFNIVSGKTYSISFDTNNNGGKIYPTDSLFNYTSVTCDGNRKTMRAVAKKTGNYKSTVLLYTQEEATTAYNLSNIMVIEGTGDASYEEYTEPQIYCNRGNGNELVYDNSDMLNSFLQKVYTKTSWGTAKSTSNVNVNAGDGGASYLISYSGHNSTGNATNVYLGLLRCGYNGNNYSIIEIIKNNGTGGVDISFNVDANGYLTHQNGASNGATKLAIYKLT